MIITKARLLQSYSWSTRDFWLLWIGQTISNFGDHLYLFVIIWWTIAELGATVAAFGIPLIVTVVNLVASPFAGVMVDRYNRQAILLLATAVYLIVMLLFAFWFLVGSVDIYAIYAFVALMAAIDSVYETAFGASVPDAVAREDIVRANGLIETGRAVNGIAAPIVAGMLFTLASAGVLLLLNAVTFLINLGCIAMRGGSSLLKMQPSQTDRRDRSKRSLLSDVKEGLNALSDLPLIRQLILIMALANVIMAPLGILIPAYVNEDLGQGATQAGLMTSAFAIGVLLMSQYVVHRPPETTHGNGMAASFVLLLIGDGLVGFAHRIEPAVVGSVLAGMGTIGVLMLGRSTMQRTAPRELRGRISSIVFVTATVLRPLGLFVGATISSAWSPRAAIIAAAIAFGLLALFSAYRVPRQETAGNV